MHIKLSKHVSFCGGGGVLTKSLNSENYKLLNNILSYNILYITEYEPKPY